MKEISITLIVSEEDFDKAVKRNLRKIDIIGNKFAKECFKETAKMMRNNEDNTLMLSKCKTEIIDVTSLIEDAIMEKSLEQIDNQKVYKDDLKERVENLLGLKDE